MLKDLKVLIFVVKMGFDFNLFYKVYIQYQKDNELKLKEHILESTRNGGYWVDCERDEEEEELIDYYDRREEQKRDQIDYELQNYPKADIFKDRKWLVNDTIKENYVNILKKYGILEKEIVLIWKEGDCIVK